MSLATFLQACALWSWMERASRAVKGVESQFQRYLRDGIVSQLRCHAGMEKVSVVVGHNVIACNVVIES